MTRYALVIGIAQYQSPNLLALPKAVTDAEVFAQVLEDYGDYKVTRLPGRRNADKNRFEMVDKKVGGKELGEELKNLLLERGENSEVLIYYAGHGFTTSDNLGRQQGFLATSDSQLEISGETIVSQKNSISLESLNQLIQDSNLSSLVMLFDCCHSGFFLESQLVQKTLSAFTSQKDYYLITACRSFETARSFKGEAHTIFTGSLLKGLSPENTGIHRRVTGDRLFDFISGDLKNSAQQEPIRLGWGKSITLVTYPPTENHSEKLPESFAVDRSNPYVGLASFSLEENEYFFGRETAVRDLLEFLKNGRFLAVIGPSGCGKSSLIKAGLLPLLKKNGLPGSKDWPVAIFTPGTQPLENLARAFYSSNISQNSILFIDQFEELFTLCDNEEQRKEFIHRITQEATNTERFTRVILSMRGDFLDRCAQYQEIADLVNKTQPTTYMVTKLTPAELEEAIEKPATKHGVDFEWGLVGEIIGDVVDQAGALPLLQYALAELWRVCVSNSKEAKPQLTCECYKNIGGVGGALEKRADELYHNLEQSDKKLVQKLFLELVQLGEGKEVTRRRASWEDLEIIADSREQLERVTRQLAGQQQRLIITDEDTVEVAHEALLTEWRLLVNWIEENRESLRLGRRLKSECLEWEKNQKSEEWLLADAWLAGIAKWVEKTQPRLSGIEQEFLSNSLDKRDREIQEKLTQERRLREIAEARQKDAEDRIKAEVKQKKTAIGGGIFLAVLAIISIGLAQIAYSERNRVVISQKQEISSMISKAEELLESNPLLALIETTKTLNKLEQTGINDLEFILRIHTLMSKIKERNRLDHPGKVEGVSWNKTGDIFASGSTDGTVKVWNLDGTLKYTLLKQKIEKSKSSAVSAVSLSPNGEIASAYEDGTIRIWKADGSLYKEKTVEPLPRSQRFVADINYSYDGKFLVSGHGDGTVKLWKSDMTLVKSFPDERGERPKYIVFDISVDSQRKQIASAYGDGKVKLWNFDGTLKHTLSDPTSNNYQTWEVAFYKDKFIATSHNDGFIRIWNSQGVLKHKLQDKTAPNITITSISISPNGEMIAGGCSDEVIRIWHLSKPNDIIRLKGHDSSVKSVSFSPDGQNLLSGSEDGTVRIWNLFEKPSLRSNYNSREMEIIGELRNTNCKWLKNYLYSHNEGVEYKVMCP